MDTIVKIGTIRPCSLEQLVEAAQTDSTAIRSISWEWMFRVLKVAVEYTADGIIVVDTEGIIRFANPVAVKAHGYAWRTNLLGKDLLTLHTPEQMVEHVMPFMHDAMRLGYFEGPLDHVRSDGAIFHTDTKMALVRDDNGEKLGLIIFYTDTSQHQETSDALAPTQNREPAAFHQRLTRSMDYRYGGDNEKLHGGQKVVPLQPCAAQRDPEHLHADTPTELETGHEGNDPYLELRKAAGGPLDTAKLADLAELLKRLS